MIESLAFTHASLAYEDTNPTPQLRSFEGINVSLAKSAVGVLALSVALSIISVAENAMAYLSYGSRGNDVVYLQDLLKRAGYFSYAVGSTGYYGSITYDAVVSYQYDMGLAVDGMAGAQTFASLEANTGVGGGTHRVVATGGLNVRSGMGTSFPVIGGLANGQRVFVESFDHTGWAKLTTGGYVSGDYLAAL
ncbi:MULTISPECIES: peptidoglycan-binding protein [unclassified Roseofilum]|uniref:peptidoglycan-binding protein n=1 Tax=unclassified Roseofilum TaxID=2620099 RepID=UPI001B057D3F|nr:MULTISPECIES: peptidoglycan-binding protein [unclassified Roseofilum]MBP0007444.1 peptidoglycan-binding protein [Roseofilum sp. Belize Diploria]MBP0011972.1 peptidoglycan-binding protein [Roseofilum sp. SID3]MBP0022973.1 peptidoglycan-binding protein [Roseofilum sp. SID2]MBP0032458.1 peptidoglycan-binding protein [Roseofilum sp. Belize BBD 4]MBP0037470.1 peptidoglycan-binding protein [Roseofilum sp. SID1]